MRAHDRTARRRDGDEATLAARSDSPASALSGATCIRAAPASSPAPRAARAQAASFSPLPRHDVGRRTRDELLVAELLLLAMRAARPGDRPRRRAGRTRGRRRSRRPAGRTRRCRPAARRGRRPARRSRPGPARETLASRTMVPCSRSSARERLRPSWLTNARTVCPGWTPYSARIAADRADQLLHQAELARAPSSSRARASGRGQGATEIEASAGRPGNRRQSASVMNGMTGCSSRSATSKVWVSHRARDVAAGRRRRRAAA